MSKTLVLLFHPDSTRSRANAAMRTAISAVDGVEVVDMQAIYPHGGVDAEVETKRLLASDRIVLQFPVQWYSTPPLLRSWQDTVLTQMYYLAYEAQGKHLEGTPVLVAATAGNRSEAYSPDGVNLFALEDLLRPLQAMANRCGLPWARPFVLYSANQLDDAQLASAGRRYAQRLRAWIESTSRIEEQST